MLNEFEYDEFDDKSIEFQRIESCYKQIFENAGDSIVHTDYKGKILDVNRSFEKTFGYKSEDIVGRPYHEINILREEDIRKISEYIKDIQIDDSSKMVELKAISKDGHPKFVEVNSSLIRRGDRVTESVSIIRDITERKYQEKILREKTESFKTFFENANDGIVYLDDNAVIRASNKKVEELFGYTSDNLIGKKFTELDIFHPVDMVNIFTIFQGALNGEGPPLIEIEGIHKSGKRFYLEINQTLISENENSVSILASIRDITQRKVVEERSRLIDIIEATPDFVFTYDANGKIQYLNQAGRAMFGFSPGDDMTLHEGIPSETHNGIWTGERTLTAKDKSDIIVSQVVMAHQKFEFDEIYYSTIMRDITEQKQNDKHIKDLTRLLIKVQEDERLRISRELHDDLAQNLSALKIICENFFGFSFGIGPGLRKKIKKMTRICQESIDSIRQLTYNLRPASLDQLGIVKTVSEYCKDFQHTNSIEVEFYSGGLDKLRLDFDTEINIYRVVQESLHNIKKHANASLVKVNLISSYPNIILQIEDNGKGFDLSSRKKELITEKRMGLISIEERVGLLKGMFKIQSKKKVGTRIHVEVPCNERIKM
ncbi:MAG: PAS domain S-box protein [Desulfobacterales bacterium]|nr:PAS domain S-box protein [Desulfobacterales bacterium]MCP4159577.1 PAS domain S-box protein [Deltaproteobacteria bacterium]